MRKDLLTIILLLSLLFTRGSFTQPAPVEFKVAPKHLVAQIYLPLEPRFSEESPAAPQHQVAGPSGTPFRILLLLLPLLRDLPQTR